MYKMSINVSEISFLQTIADWVVAGILTAISGLTSGLFIYRSLSNPRARRVLKGIWEQDVSRPHFYIKQFVRMNFRASYTQNSQFTEKELWKYITGKDIEKSPIVFICGEAGSGKSRLLQQYAYRLKARRDITKAIEPNLGWKVYVKCLCFANLSIDELIGELKNCSDPAHTIVLLDGFDTCPELRTHSAEDVLDKLFSVMKKESTKFKRIVITSRIEAFAKGSEVLGSKSIWQKTSTIQKKQRYTSDRTNKGIRESVCNCLKDILFLFFGRRD